MISPEEAFSLSVSMKLRIDHRHNGRQSVMVGDGQSWAIEDYNGDAMAATCRAIERVARKKGKWNEQARSSR